MSQSLSAEGVNRRLLEHGVSPSEVASWNASPAVDPVGMLTLLDAPYLIGVENAARLVCHEVPSWVAIGYLDRGHTLDDVTTLWEATTRSSLLMLGLAGHIGPHLSITTIDYLSRLGVALTPLMLNAADWTAGSPTDGSAARLALAHWLIYDSDVTEAHRFVADAHGQPWVDTAARLALDGMKIDVAIEAAHRLEEAPAHTRVRIHRAGLAERAARAH